MKLLRIIQFVVVFLLTPATIIPRLAYSEYGWLTYRAQSGFSINYPGNWMVIGNAPNWLDILSSKERVEGVVIVKGESNVIVHELLDYKRQPLKNFIHSGNKIIEDSIRKINTSEKNKCREYEEISELIYLIEDHAQIQTSMFCIIGSRAFVLSLHNWEEDGRKGLHLDVAERMIASLQIN